MSQTQAARWVQVEDVPPSYQADQPSAAFSPEDVVRAFEATTRMVSVLQQQQAVFCQRLLDITEWMQPMELCASGMGTFRNGVFYPWTQYCADVAVPPWFDEHCQNEEFVLGAKEYVVSGNRQLSPVCGSISVVQRQETPFLTTVVQGAQQALELIAMCFRLLSVASTSLGTAIGLRKVREAFAG